MYVLGIETTGPVGSVAVMNEKGTVAIRRTTEKMSHLREITAMTEEVLKEMYIKPANLELITVSVGPGSFTGIRIGVTTARTLSQAIGAPCKGVSSLEIFREKTIPENPAYTGKGAAIIFNARRGQVYGAVYGSKGEEILKPGPYMLEDVLEVVERQKEDEFLFYGDGVDSYMDRLSGLSLAPKEERYPDASMVARLGRKFFDEAGGDSYESILPNYMRIAEAEQRLKDGSLKRMQEEKKKRYANA